MTDSYIDLNVEHYLRNGELKGITKKLNTTVKGEGSNEKLTKLTEETERVRNELREVAESEIESWESNNRSLTALIKPIIKLGKRPKVAKENCLIGDNYKFVLRYPRIAKKDVAIVTIDFYGVKLPIRVNFGEYEVNLVWKTKGSSTVNNPENFKGFDIYETWVLLTDEGYDEVDPFSKSIRRSSIFNEELKDIIKVEYLLYKIEE